MAPALVVIIPRLYLIGLIVGLLRFCCLGGYRFGSLLEDVGFFHITAHFIHVGHIRKNAGKLLGVFTEILTYIHRSSIQKFGVAELLLIRIDGRQIIQVYYYDRVILTQKLFVYGQDSL